MPKATYRTHFHLEPTLEAASRGCAAVSGGVCMECELLDSINYLYDSNPLRGSLVGDAYGCLPIIALAAKAVTIPKGRFTSRR